MFIRTLHLNSNNDDDDFGHDDINVGDQPSISNRPDGENEGDESLLPEIILGNNDEASFIILIIKLKEKI
jgi:hypothetical protein